MAITKTVAIDQTTVESNGIVLYRETTKILEDGVEISKSFHRTSLYPGQDLTGQPASVVKICNLVWTQDLIDSYKASIIANHV
jgi:hypothetical protein